MLVPLVGSHTVMGSGNKKTIFTDSTPKVEVRGQMGGLLGVQSLITFQKPEHTLHLANTNPASTSSSSSSSSLPSTSGREKAIHTNYSPRAAQVERMKKREEQRRKKEEQRRKKEEQMRKRELSKKKLGERKGGS